MTYSEPSCLSLSLKDLAYFAEPIISWIVSQDRIDLIAEKGKSYLFDPAELNSSISFYQGALIGNGAKC